MTTLIAGSSLPSIDTVSSSVGFHVVVDRVLSNFTVMESLPLLTTLPESLTDFLPSRSTTPTQDLAMSGYFASASVLHFTSLQGPASDALRLHGTGEGRHLDWRQAGASRLTGSRTTNRAPFA